jgi:hypothetical protein
MERQFFTFTTYELLCALQRLPLDDEVVISKEEYFYRREHDVPKTHILYGTPPPYTLH